MHTTNKEGKVWGQPDSLTDPPYYPGWWGGNFRGAREYPINLEQYQSQLVYSPHDYGPGVYNQTWFNKDFTTQTLLDDYWYDTWAYLNAEDIAPLLMGEWGGFMDGAENEKWLNLLRDYMIDNHINHTFWCINPNSGDTGGLLDYSFTNWDVEKYTLFEKSLWQTQETGKYIGLDHKTPLGVNGTGISLSEFYNSYAHEEGSNIDNGTILDKENKPTNPTDPTDKPTEPVKPTNPTEPATDDSETSTETPSETINENDVLYGDVDCNGKVEVNDIVSLNMYLLDKDANIPGVTAQGLLNANCEYDDVIDLADSSKIINFLAELISEDELGK